MTSEVPAMLRIVFALAAAVLATAMPASAQQPGHHQHGHGDGGAPHRRMHATLEG